MVMMNNVKTEKLKPKNMKITEGCDLILKPSSDINLMIMWSHNTQSKLRSDPRKSK
jgi:hypothetical protein